MKNFHVYQPKEYSMAKRKENFIFSAQPGFRLLDLTYDRTLDVFEESDRGPILAWTLTKNIFEDVHYNFMECEPVALDGPVEIEKIPTNTLLVVILPDGNYHVPYIGSGLTLEEIKRNLKNEVKNTKACRS